jgi:hypothetical protein
MVPSTLDIIPEDAYLGKLAGRVWPFLALWYNGDGHGPPWLAGASLT